MRLRQIVCQSSSVTEGLAIFRVWLGQLESQVRRFYVGMTRGRHHNLAYAITEATGDEHTRRPAPTPGEVLAGALRCSSAEKSATETLRDELQSLQPETSLDHRHAILEGLRQAQNHSYQHALRRQAQRQANSFPGHSPAPSINSSGPQL